MHRPINRYRPIGVTIGAIIPTIGLGRHADSRREADA